MQVSLDELHAVRTYSIGLVIDYHVVQNVHGGFVYSERIDNVLEHLETLMADSPRSAFIKAGEQQSKVDKQVLRLQ